MRPRAYVVFFIDIVYVLCNCKCKESHKNNCKDELSGQKRHCKFVNLTPLLSNEILQNRLYDWMLVNQLWRYLKIKFFLYSILFKLMQVNVLNFWFKTFSEVLIHERYHLYITNQFKCYFASWNQINSTKATRFVSRSTNNRYK